jgi:hypothetical protein
MLANSDPNLMAKMVEYQKSLEEVARSKGEVVRRKRNVTGFTG